MGRPRKSERRDKQLNLSLTESEFDNINRRALAIGMRPVHFGRAILLDRDRKVEGSRGSDGNVEKLIYAQLQRLGNNLNQLVRYLHKTGDPLPADLEPLLKDLRHILERRVMQ
jgi:Bacterial mobilisation protein (MobC)